MIRRAHLFAAGVAALALSGVALTQDRTEEIDLDVRVRVLEAEAVRNRELMSRTLSYLELQGEAADRLLESLEDVEELGFTHGMNYKSREELLAGLRGYLRARKAGLPEAPPPLLPPGELPPALPK